jgi:hypothetical protein
LKTEVKCRKNWQRNIEFISRVNCVCRGAVRFLLFFLSSSHQNHIKTKIFNSISTTLNLIFRSTFARVNEIIQSLIAQSSFFASSLRRIFVCLFLFYLYYFILYTRNKNFFNFSLLFDHHHHRLVFIENELDFFFHLHFFDILTGKKNIITHIIFFFISFLFYYFFF